MSRGAARKPANCSVCNSPLVELSSVLSSYQGCCSLRVQESLSDTGAGAAETPVSLQLMGEEVLLDTVQTGDTVDVCGIYRLRGDRLNNWRRSIRSVFRPFVEVLSCAVVKKCGEADLEAVLKQDAADFLDNMEVPQELREMMPRTDADDDENLLKLTKSIAPSVFGAEYDGIKLALLL